MLFSWQLISLLAIVSTNVGGTNLGNRRRGKHLVICSPNHNHVESPLQWSNFLQTNLTKIIQGFLHGMVETDPVILSRLQLCKGREMGLKPVKSQTAARQEPYKGRFPEKI